MGHEAHYDDKASTECCLFKPGHTGNAASGWELRNGIAKGTHKVGDEHDRICMVKKYKLTQGFCRPPKSAAPANHDKYKWSTKKYGSKGGGDAGKGGDFWMCVGSKHTVAKCQLACNKMEDCAA